MASWSRVDGLALTGTGSITVDTNIVTGTGTAFLTEVELNSLITLDTSVFMVKAINSDVEIEVLPIAEVGLAAQAVLLSQAPKYLPVTQINNVLYVEVDEISALTRADGIKTPGWTLYEEYGDGRKRVETLVAMKSTT
jgi:hypothetical protein